MQQTDIEVWEVIPDFSNYEISNLGNVFNRRTGNVMMTSINNYGHVKISLCSEWNGERFTRSVAQMVAEAFVEAPNPLCDQVVVLDGDFSHVSSDNLVWRPRWFAWKYTRQLKTFQPVYYRNLPVINLVKKIEYENIISAGMGEGLLFVDIWRSTYTGEAIYPDGSVFQIAQNIQ